MGRRCDRRWVGIDRSRWTQCYADSRVDASAGREGRRRAVSYARPTGRKIDAGDRKQSRSEEEDARQVGKAGVEEAEERSGRRHTALARPSPRRTVLSITPVAGPIEVGPGAVGGDAEAAAR